MADSKAVPGLLQAARFGRTGALRGLMGDARAIVVVSLVLICGSLASAALIQMRLDRQHALSQAAVFEAQRAASLAVETSGSLDRYLAIARGFASDTLDAESAAALAEAGGPSLKNVAVLDESGRLLSEMKVSPRGLLPLSAGTIRRIRSAPLVGPSADGRSIVVISAASNRRIVALQLEPRLLVAGMPDALLAMPSGRLLWLGANWSEMPDVAALTLEDGISASRIVEFPRGAKLVSLSKLPGWPLLAGTSADVSLALQAWYGTLPLYLFFIFAPALAGAGLAAVFVREFERRLKAAAAVRSLRSRRPEEARLLVRLADAERRAVHAERAKAEFMSHISHELRTPLNAIIGFSQLIEQGTLGAVGNPKYTEYAQDISRAGRQLHARIGDLLDFADLDARRRVLAAETVDISAVARETLYALRDQAQVRGVRLLAALPQDCCASADRAAVGRIFSGLLANAVEFTPRGGEIRVFVRGEKDCVLTSVRDSGLGFSKEELARAGEAFRRFERPGHATGLGLGLSMATTLARRMGGSLRVESVQGEGTSVHLRLPLAEPVAAAS